MQPSPESIALITLCLATFALWAAISKPKYLKIAQVAISAGSALFAIFSLYQLATTYIFWPCLLTSVALGNIAAAIQVIRKNGVTCAAPTESRLL